MKQEPTPETLALGASSEPPAEDVRHLMQRTRMSRYVDIGRARQVSEIKERWPLLAAASGALSRNAQESAKD
jgi:hypothetical protein